jgi:hypothetical protein
MWLLWALTAVLLIVGVTAAVAAATGTGGPAPGGGLVFVFLLAVFTGSGARAVGRGGRPGTADDWLSATAAAAPPRDSPGRPAAQSAGQSAAQSDEPGQAPPPGLPAADPGVSYRERHSQFPVIGGPVAIGLLAGSIAGLVVAGGPSSRGYGPLGGLLVLLVVLTVLFLAFTAADLPNGIDIAGGRFTVGVLDGRPRGRLRRRIAGQLAVVRSWDVLTPAQVRKLHKHRPTRSTAGRQLQYLGDLRMLGRSGVLRLVVPPGSVRASFPAQVLAGYAFVPAAQAGAIWDGVILICTRRPAALAAALDQALPGRRAAPETADVPGPGQGIRS